MKPQILKGHFGRMNWIDFDIVQTFATIKGHSSEFQKDASLRISVSGSKSLADVGEFRHFCIEKTYETNKNFLGVIGDESATDRIKNISLEIKQSGEIQLEKYTGNESTPSSKDLMPEDIALISSFELSQKLSEAKEKIRKENLVYRPNAEQVTQTELKEAKKIFELIALISLEQANRKLKQFEPEFDQGLANVGRELALIREMLGE